MACPFLPHTCIYGAAALSFNIYSHYTAGVLAPFCRAPLPCPVSSCRRMKSIRDGSWFSGSHLSLEKILEITYLWCEDLP